ncbi:Uncharacterised protein [Pragia fontium]|uniref:hypothetical protein n=1 Tax=Pragia fontium TaxID=82985 RepID=UPI000E06AD99|nr:hypothetical protein [Pragia fontium]SUB82446.1 Uncharacterised protein [Pragia fontium]
MSSAIRISLLTLAIGALYFPAANASESCPITKETNNNNHLALLSIPSFNHAREIETVTERDNTGSFYYFKFNYDRCGQLQSMYAQISKNEQRFRIDSVYDVRKTADGWKNSYNVTLIGLNKLLYAREGNILYGVNQQGLITHSTDSFISGGEGKVEQGVTNGSYTIDDLNRMAYSQLTGSDETVNGEYRFFYNANNMPSFLTTPSVNISYLYDAQNRNNRMIETTVSPYYLGNKLTDCTEWNSQNDCTRSVSREIELFPAYAIDRQTTLRSTYSYWSD